MMAVKTFRLLVIGDFHIPERAFNIPRRVLSIIKEGGFDLILCTGDLVEREVLELLKHVSTVKWVMGNMDYLPGPIMEKVRLGELKIGLTHGTRIYPRGDLKQLYSMAKGIDVDILISGHTHTLSIQLFNEVVLLNPGSATGVWGGGPASMKPSFIILEVEDGEASVKAYELTEGRLREFIKRFRKKEGRMVETN